ncbi:MAG: SDR family oxidoreductase [Clostridium sp.]|nr:SDR family oxidoreductase [Clostridium sp.]
MKESVQKAMFDYFRLEGQAAIVTGSGNGIGRATAIMLADLGARVTVCDIEEDSAQKVAEEIAARGGTAIACRCDVTILEEIRETIRMTAQAFGGVDILVNNAAGFGGGKTFDKMTYEEWDRLIRINLTGAYMFTNEVLPYMVKKQHGKICMVSSGAALGYDFSDPHYAASKAGMIGLAKELSQELAKHRINVNVLGTGLTDTRMAHLPGRSWEDETKGLPWYRVGTPEDQAAAIVFLVSEAAEYITGQVLCPNGGAWM